MLVLETESADRDLLINQTENSQQSLHTTTEVVELGMSVAVPETTRAHFDVRAGNRLSGISNPWPIQDSVPDMSRDANVDDPHLSLGRSVHLTV